MKNLKDQVKTWKNNYPDLFETYHDQSIDILADIKNINPIQTVEVERILRGLGSNPYHDNDNNVLRWDDDLEDIPISGIPVSSLLCPDNLFVYRPYHVFHDWGVFFHSESLVNFSEKLRGQLMLLGVFTDRLAMLKIATYVLYRHAHQQLLVELEGSRLELNTIHEPSPQRYYIPYYTNVYLSTYPSIDCWERLLATLVTLHPNVANFGLVKTCLVNELSSWGPVFAKGCLIRKSAKPAILDNIAAQINQGKQHPVMKPELSGLMLQAYQPVLTRYKDVPTYVYGKYSQIVADALNNKPLRSTIKINTH